MSTAVSAWTCPQCSRRVPGRAALCHCGFTRAAASLTSANRPAEATTGWLPVLTALGAVCLVAALALSAARPGTTPRAASPYSGPRMRGPVGYAPLPVLAVPKARHVSRGSAPTLLLPPGMAPLTPASLRPATAAEQDWARAAALLDLPLRKIAADTSVLALTYLPFADACVDGAAADEWLASLKHAALRPGVTLRDAGVTVDCDTARAHLVARCDALKADLAAALTLAETNHVTPEHWRTLLASHDLSGWEKY
jgi:hypothetical protein